MASIPHIHDRIISLATSHLHGQFYREDAHRHSGKTEECSWLTSQQTLSNGLVMQETGLRIHFHHQD